MSHLTLQVQSLAGIPGFPSLPHLTHLCLHVRRFQLGIFDQLSSCISCMCRLRHLTIEVGEVTLGRGGMNPPNRVLVDGAALHQLVQRLPNNLTLLKVREGCKTARVQSHGVVMS